MKPGTWIIAMLPQKLQGVDLQLRNEAWDIARVYCRDIPCKRRTGCQRLIPGVTWDVIFCFGGSYVAIMLSIDEENYDCGCCCNFVCILRLGFLWLSL